MVLLFKKKPKDNDLDKNKALPVSKKDKISIFNYFIRGPPKAEPNNPENENAETPKSDVSETIQRCGSLDALTSSQLAKSQSSLAEVDDQAPETTDCIRVEDYEKNVRVANDNESPESNGSIQKFDCEKDFLVKETDTTPSPKNLLATEICTKAKMRRFNTGIIDMEFTSGQTKMLLQHRSPVGSPQMMICKENEVPTMSLSPLARNRMLHTYDADVAGRSASTSRCQLSTSSGSRTTPNARASGLTRMASQSIACPGFDSAAAENELRKALELRKMKTARLDCV